MVRTQPSTRSAPAVYLSNWKDIIAIWKARRLAQKDTVDRGPGISELHFLGARASGWPISQIKGYTGAFRDETGNQRYTEIDNFETDAFVSGDTGTAGSLVTRYLSYCGAEVQPRCDITRTYAAVPQQPFLVIRYTLTNTTASDLEFSLLDQVVCNNTVSEEPFMSVHGFYDGARKALIADMTAVGQCVLILGAFGSMDGHQVGDPTNTDPISSNVSGAVAFAANGALPGDSDLMAPHLSLGFVRHLSIAAGATAEVNMYLVVQADLSSALAAADLAHGASAESWFSATATATTGWLAAGGRDRRPNFPDSGMAQAYDSALVTIKNMQHPVLGTVVASSNPFAYGYKTWVRDGAVTAIALDAAGHHDEAGRFLRWMASVQGADGSWKTTYDFWTGAHLGWVEPEYDSIGAFCYAVYCHYRATRDALFESDLWPTVKRAADCILHSLSASNGLGAADFSIWEETERGLQHNSYTQAWYVAGLWAVQQLAEIRGDTADADWYAGGPASILTALQRPSNWVPPGLWNPAGYYNRGVNADNSPAPLADSSSNALMALGIVDHRCRRASSHVQTMLSLLTKDGYGLARYQDDNYYYSSRFGPASDEVGGPEPAWPQMSMWVAAFESLGNPEAALHRMQWFVSTTGVGYMPPGEAVSHVTSLSVLSSMSEPLTAASYVLAALTLDGLFDIRIRPPVSNAGTYKKVSVAASAKGDDELWRNVPYFVGSGARLATGQTSIRRAYLANDEATVYVRIDDVAGSSPVFNVEPAFAVRIYSSDFAGQGGEATRRGLDRAPLNRAVSYAVERRSTEDRLRRWAVAGGNWESTPEVGNGVEAQWDPATGRIEIGVPISALSNTPPTAGVSWASLGIALTLHDPTSDTWTETDRLWIHYRFTTPDQAWIYGDIEQ